MKAYLVVLDSARARLLRWQDPEDPDLDGSASLTELADLVNPEGRLQDKEIFSTRLHTNRTTGAGQPHAFDDHREGNREESFRRFVRDVVRRLSEDLRQETFDRLLIMAETQTLSDLREELSGVLPRGLIVIELAENVAKQSAVELQERLVKKGILPAPTKGAGPSAGQFVPRGQPMPGSDVKP
jgi:protein required for attachment to host cells